MSYLEPRASPFSSRTLPIWSRRKTSPKWEFPQTGFCPDEFAPFCPICKVRLGIWPGSTERLCCRWFCPGIGSKILNLYFLVGFSSSLLFRPFTILTRNTIFTVRWFGQKTAENKRKMGDISPQLQQGLLSKYDLIFHQGLLNILNVTGIFRKDRSSFLLNHRYLEEIQ